MKLNIAKLLKIIGQVVVAAPAVVAAMKPVIDTTRQPKPIPTPPAPLNNQTKNVGENLSSSI